MIHGFSSSSNLSTGRQSASCVSRMARGLRVSVPEIAATWKPFSWRVLTPCTAPIASDAAKMTVSMSAWYRGERTMSWFSCWYTPSAISKKATPHLSFARWATSCSAASSSRSILCLKVDAKPTSVKSNIQCAPASLICQKSFPDPVPVTFAAPGQIPILLRPWTIWWMVVVFPAFIAVPKTTMVRGRVTVAGSIRGSAKSSTLMGCPRWSPMMPRGTISVAALTALLRDCTWEAIPPEATSCVRPSVVGTYDSYWSVAYRSAYATIIMSPRWIMLRRPFAFSMRRCLLIRETRARTTSPDRGRSQPESRVSIFPFGTRRVAKLCAARNSTSLGRSETRTSLGINSISWCSSIGLYPCFLYFTKRISDKIIYVSILIRTFFECFFECYSMHKPVHTLATSENYIQCHYKKCAILK